MATVLIIFLRINWPNLNFAPPPNYFFLPWRFLWRIWRRRGCIWTPLKRSSFHSWPDEIITAMRYKITVHTAVISHTRTHSRSLYCLFPKLRIEAAMYRSNMILQKHHSYVAEFFLSPCFTARKRGPGLPWIWISMDKSMDISMDIMLAHLLIKLTTLYVLSLTFWLCQFYF